MALGSRTPDRDAELWQALRYGGEPADAAKGGAAACAEREPAGAQDEPAGAKDEPAGAVCAGRTAGMGPLRRAALVALLGNRLAWTGRAGPGHGPGSVGRGGGGGAAARGCYLAALESASETAGSDSDRRSAVAGGSDKASALNGIPPPTGTAPRDPGGAQAPPDTRFGPGPSGDRPLRSGRADPHAALVEAYVAACAGLAAAFAAGPAGPGGSPPILPGPGWAAPADGDAVAREALAWMEHAASVTAAF